MSLTLSAMKSLQTQALIIIIIFTATAITAETGGTANKWSTSAELADLLHTETVLIENLRSYVNALDSKIAAIKNKTQEIRAIYDVVLNDTSKYIGNPINTFKLIKRMTYEWPAIRTLAWEDVTGHIVENITTFSEFLTFPTEEDLDESVGNLLRVQDVYKMEPSQVAMGEFDGMKFGSQMTWSDCFAIGQQSFNQGEHLVAKVWLQTALEKLPSNEKSPQYVNARVEVLQTLANSEYQSGNLKEALRLTDQILELNPKNKRAIAAQASFREKLKRKQVKPTKKSPKSKETKLTEELFALDVCRGAFEQYSLSQSFERMCAYITGNLPFLLIGPVRFEIIKVDPFIAIYHNVFSDSEIENLRDSLRNDKEWIVPRNYSKRLEMSTGYGALRIGKWRLIRNHYNDETHLQLSAMKTTQMKEEGDGLMWIQLNQPKLGGFIAFPQLEIRLATPRGSVLYWATRNEFSDVDYRTKHVTCPVIAGTLEGLYSVTMSK